jgi:hypothetical protein
MLNIRGQAGWLWVFSIAQAGAGIRAGLVHVASDRIGGTPRHHPVGPHDLVATIFHAHGLHSHVQVCDRLNRPLPITHGRPLEELFG